MCWPISGVAAAGLSDAAALERQLLAAADAAARAC